MRRRKVILRSLVVGAFAFTILTSAACEPLLPSAEVETLSTHTPILPADTPTLESASPRLPERAPTPEPDATTGEVPPALLNAILDDVAARSGIERNEFVVVKAEAVLWNDGSLGCPQPGQFYIQSLVEGYRVVLSHDGQEFDYRASDRGFFFLCEQHFPQGNGTPMGDTGKAPGQ